jgi:hypothetical protein
LEFEVIALADLHPVQGRCANSAITFDKASGRNAYREELCDKNVALDAGWRSSALKRDHVFRNHLTLAELSQGSRQTATHLR